MSYIRSTSNPESLNVYSTGEQIEICWNVGQPEIGHVSNEDFNLIMETYRKWDFVFLDGKIVSESLIIEQTDDFKVRLIFPKDNNKSVDLWDVTWNEVVRNHERDKLRNWIERFKFLFDYLRYFSY